MRRSKWKTFLMISALGGMLLGNTPCFPTRDQLAGTINNGILSGIGLAISLGLDALLRQGLPDTTTQKVMH